MLHNVGAGFRLAFFLPSRLSNFRITHDVLLSLIALSVLLNIISDWSQVKPEREFNSYGVSYLAVSYLLEILSLYLISHIYGRPDQLKQLLVISFSIYPTIWLADRLLERFVDPLGELAYWISFVCIWIWILIILTRYLNLIFEYSWYRLIASLALYLAGYMSLIFIIPHQTLWYSNNGLLDEINKQQVNIEDSYYKQYDLVKDSLHYIEPGNPNKTEIYFVGYAPFSLQDVFLRETRLVETFMDKHWHTRDRSLLLINHHETLHDHPLANRYNLGHSLKGIAEKMDSDDILFLFLTSHGSKTYELAANYWPLEPNNLSASKLAWTLNDSGIRWRIIFISACYSGGFIDQLKDPHTLVLTASARDRQSFGCSSENEFTWFTNAYFNIGLQQTDNMLEAFYIAQRHIQQQERSEGIEASDPQIYVGEKMKERLGSLKPD